MTREQAMPGKRRSNGEGTIYQRQDGRWEASYRTTEGRKISLYAATQEEARRQLAQAVADRDRGLPAPRDERQTVAASRTDSPQASGPIPQYIFVSYSHSDDGFAARLSEDLRSRHFSLWIDSSGITPGAPDYEQVIRDAIPNSVALVLVGSLAASTLVSVRGEVAKTRAVGCPIIPIWAEGERWVDSAPLALSDA